MTQETPPGWYPDPGQTSDGPPTERWWDGKAWTQQTRPVGAAAWGPPAYPPGYPPAVGTAPQPRRGLRTGIAVTATILVLAGIGGGVYALTADDGSGGSGRTNAQQPGPGFSPPGGQDGPGDGGGRGGPDGGGSASPAPTPTEGGVATDAASGISMPVLDGWRGISDTIGAGVSTGEYQCPGDTSKSCVRGGANSLPAVALGLKATTAEAAAKQDIASNAEQSYGGDTYGKITSHEELASKAVTVAGQKGYMVRWKVITEKGDDGYVESLAFPSPLKKDMLVVVRFGIDVNSKAPKVAVMDEITKGIKAASGGGSGQDV
ncbi:DUF2510 domain-containing protein [Streptomyces cavernae]|uniref:DUF2510 domain-containing protein n=1 Tax=Streptomyces cavernae TaxID=2259034 RepID=UPI000FEC0A98|nr:DUF2510 domain-containing protein [Streptomyces cavernae]